MSALNALFSHVCGQQHCWILGGQTLPLCERCTGLYVGALLGIVLVLIFRPRPSAFLYWFHGLLMLAIVPFGFHLIEHGAYLRTFTGTLFGFGLAYYLALNPFTLWRFWKNASAARVWNYTLFLFIASVALLLVLSAGGAVSAFAITGLAVSGFVAVTAFTVFNLATLPGTLRALRQQSA